ncbi:hypothetical protein ACFLRA_00520 [Bdellovibrionota bacterium]
MVRIIFSLVLLLVISFPNSSFADPIVTIERIIQAIMRNPGADNLLRVRYLEKPHLFARNFPKIVGNADDHALMLRTLREPSGHMLLNRRMAEIARTERYGQQFSSILAARSRMRKFRFLIGEYEAISALESHGRASRIIAREFPLVEFEHLGIDFRQAAKILDAMDQRQTQILELLTTLENTHLVDPFVVREMAEFSTFLGRVHSGMRIGTDTLREGMFQLSEALAKTRISGGFDSRVFREWSELLQSLWIEAHHTSQIFEHPLYNLHRLARLQNTDEAVVAFHEFTSSPWLATVRNFFPSAGEGLPLALLQDLYTLTDQALGYGRYGKAFEAVALSRSLVTVRKFELALGVLHPRVASSLEMQKAVRNLLELSQAQQLILRRKIARIRLPLISEQWKSIQKYKANFNLEFPTLAEDIQSLDYWLSFALKQIRQGKLNQKNLSEINNALGISDTLLESIIFTARDASFYDELVGFLHPRRALFDTLRDIIN